MTTQQLILNLNIRDEAIFDNYLAGDNAQLIYVLKKFVTDPDEPFIYCYGEYGSGRTHLLQACYHFTQKENYSAFYVSLSNHHEFSPIIFDALENQQYVFIDDVDAIAGNQAWEEALFYFYNRARENQVSLLMSATLPPQQLNYVLPDLQSRLSYGLVLEIKNLNDDEKIQALQMRARLRGLYLPQEVANYLLHHGSRNMHDLFSALETVDHASLAEQRKLTIPFIKTVLPCRQ